ncbi:hypothetical protein [Mucisphaera calidilacus]|uniref:Uncharacterized protein n=1 Tax=Mucisphaera calidilacus TaxID=2527982 RepID=A0A518BUX1_9BACT|nr:hypothetical protein [Mucisphaera calidilacus]QDU70783.1 hypothetical protein Pan265_06200 [Mucisphaera calidilacus]
MLMLAQNLDFLNNTANAAVVLGILMAVPAGIVVIVATAWVKTTRIREDAALKARMVERGMAAEEIETILKAKSFEE